MFAFGSFLARKGKVGDSMAGRFTRPRVRRNVWPQGRDLEYMLSLSRSLRWQGPGDLVDVRALDLRVILVYANVSCLFILIGVPNLTCGQDGSR